MSPVHKRAVPKRHLVFCGVECCNLIAGKVKICAVPTNQARRDFRQPEKSGSGMQDSKLKLRIPQSSGSEVNQKGKGSQ